MLNIVKNKSNYLVFLIFSVYYVFWILPFNEGVVLDNDSRLYVNLLKLLLVIFLLALIIESRVSFKVDNFLVFLFFSIYPTLFFITKTYFGVNDLFYFNYLAFTPLLLASEKLIIDIVSAVPRILAFQVVLDIFILLINGHTLWLNNAIVGGMGNPSTFGVACCIGIIFLYFGNNSRKTNNIFFFILALGAVLSQSLLALILIIFLTLVLFRLRLSIFIFVFVIFALSILLDGVLSHNLQKLNALLNTGVTTQSGSASVSLRILWFIEHIERFKADEISILIGDIGAIGYISGDNQFLGIFSLGGIFLIIPFLIYNTIIFNPLKENSFFDRKLVFCLLIIYFTFFLFNRALEYFPFSLIYFVSIIMVKYRRIRS